MRRLVITCLTLTLLAGCGMDDNADPLQVTDTLTQARPAAAPPATTPPEGTAHPAPPAQHTAYDRDTRTLVLATGPQLQLVDTTTGNRRTVDLPAAPTNIHARSGQLLAALPDAGQITRVDLRTATAHPTPVPGGPVDALDLDAERTAVIQRDTATVTILTNGQPGVTTRSSKAPHNCSTTPASSTSSTASPPPSPPSTPPPAKKAQDCAQDKAPPTPSKTATAASSPSTPAANASSPSAPTP